MTKEIKGADTLIPYSSHISPSIIKIKGGSYMMVFHLDGVSYVGKSTELIQSRVNQFNKFIKQLKAPLRYNLYITSHCVRHPYEPELVDEFESGFLTELNELYVNEKILSGMNIKTDYYLTVVFRPYRKLAGFSVFKSTFKKIQEFEHDAKETLGKIQTTVLEYFSEYNARLLTSFEKNGIMYSEPLRFLNLITNFIDKDVPVLKAQISEYICTSTLTFGSNEIIVIDNAEGRKYAAILTLAEYPTETSSGQIQAMFEKPCRMIVTQSFVPTDKSESESWLKKEYMRLESTDDASTSDLNDLSSALEEVKSDNIILGEYSWTIMIVEDDVAKLKKMISESSAILANGGFTSSVNVLAKMSAYYSQLPANLSLQPRTARVSSLNAIHMFPFYVQNRGKQYGNPWGCAISMFKTVGDDIFYFNFHDTEHGENREGSLVLGNTIISGQSGTGKTVLLSFLLAQSQRYYPRPKIILFDKDLGSSVFVKAIGGKYSQVKLGHPTGFNPFHLENTELNRSFLGQLINAILDNDNQPISSNDKNLIYAAIEQVMSTPMDMRDIESFSNYLPPGENSIKDRLLSWTKGEYAWVFNNDNDNFSLEGSSIIGIDYTEFLEVKEIRTPIMMYLFHRIELMLDGKPTIISLDEAWYPLSDPAFLKFIENKDRTIRKQNGLLIFATQSPSDFYRGVPSSFMEQISTQIFLPNPEAKHEDYVNGLGLQEEEYELIKGMHKSSREFLVKYQGESTHCKLNLHGIDGVSVLSGSEQRAELAQELIDKYGDKWLMKYYKAIEEGS